MKLYMHPVSMTCRPIRLFIVENKIDCDEEVVDLMQGAHHQEPYASLNPNRLVPMLVDGDLRLTERSAILKYLADKIGSPAYPKDLKQRAKVNEAMDWINTQLCRDLAYGFVYPQIFPTHKRPSEELQKGTLAWAKERARGWMKVLDENIIGPKKSHLCGSSITIADYFGAAFVSLAEFIRCDFRAYPNLERWYQGMKGLRTWNKVHDVFYGFAGSMKSVEFERL